MKLSKRHLANIKASWTAARKAAASRRQKLMWRDAAYKRRMGHAISVAWKAPGRKGHRRVFGEFSRGKDKELGTFHRMHDRVISGKVPSIFWPRNAAGFAAFMKEVGSIPVHLNRPSIGRKRHILGYIPGNVKWEELSINSAKIRGKDTLPFAQTKRLLKKERV